MADRVKASFLQRPWSNDPGSTRTLVTLLCFWIRSFTMIISAWWLQTSCKFTGQQFEEIVKNIGSLETPKAGANFFILEVVIAMKSVRIIQ